MKLKVNDKVQVIDDIEYTQYNGINYVSAMDEYKNRILTIDKIESENIKIKEDKGRFIWTEPMFKKITKTKQKQNEELEVQKQMNEDLKGSIGSLIDTVETLTNKMSEVSPFEQALIDGIVEKGKNIAVDDIVKSVLKEAKKQIKEQYNVLPKKEIIIKNKNGEKSIKGLFHKDFEYLVNLVKADIPVMLTGGAGAGKNFTLEQVADALDLKFYSVSSINQEYKLTGFIDANGIYQETEFYKAFTKGGMFFLDEIDASSPEALVILNGAIANKYFDFPNGRKTAHKDFRVVCAGNTYGTGADMVYVGRNQLDGATLDRFVVVKFEYDKEIEQELAFDNELYEFINDLRNATNICGLRQIISSRAIINSTKMLKLGIEKERILIDSILKHMSKDDINTIVPKLNRSNEWVELMIGMADNVRD